MTINNSTITGNTGAESIQNYGPLNLNNTTVSNNVAGGIYMQIGTVTLNNSTLTGNLFGVFTGDGYSAVVNLQNSIIANNVTDCIGSTVSRGYNLIGNSSGCQYSSSTGDLIGTNAVPIDPKLTVLQNNGGAALSHALLSDSPAINAGSPALPGSGGSSCLLTDQRGVARVGRCDIGAYEYDLSGVSVLKGSSQTQYLNTAFPIPLQVFVLDNAKNAVSGATVTFTAPASGPSGKFADTGTNTTTAITDAQGVATAPAFTSNGLAGTYSVKPTVSGYITLTNFKLTNFNILGKISTYTANNSASLPGSLLCTQAQPGCTSNADPHADAAQLYAQGTFNLYATRHLRNSIDNQGMTIVSTVHYCSPTVACPYNNAFWNGSQMVYGDAVGYPMADDVVAHELTHGVTQYESNLFYFYQSGAINESFSDLWGEYYDQTNGLGNDTGYRWALGEDITGLYTILRSMSAPWIYGDPDKMTSTYYYLGDADSGGVHRNSGVNNKAVFLMVDGGEFNGKIVKSLGWNKTESIYYEANTNLLFSGADYSDLYYAVQQACANLLGQNGITDADCQQVRNALDAVEMNAQPVANFNPDAALCAPGTTLATTIFTDNMESGTGKWASTGFWSLTNGYASSGTHMLYGDDYYPSSNSAASMAAGVNLPAGTYLHFKHAFAFEYDAGGYYDGAVLEYTINNGRSWIDAAPLYMAGRNYTGVILNYNGTTNALKGRSAFVGDSHGYVSSRYNLASLAGKTVKFRWRFATDKDYYYMGWMVDDVRIYSCGSGVAIKGNAGTAGVNLSYTDGIAKTATSQADGSYSFQVSGGWSGTVTPSKVGYTFLPATRSYSSLLSDQAYQNYNAFPSNIISGNAGAAGVTLTYIDGETRNVISRADGTYSFTVHSGWSGIVTPSKIGGIITPASRTYANVTSDQILQNYTTTLITYTITGNAGPGAAVGYLDGTFKTVNADVDGNYSLLVSYNWSGSLIPSKPGTIFSPPYISLSNVLADQAGGDFTQSAGVTIAGNVRIGGMLLSFTDGMPQTTYSAPDGSYSLAVSPGWTGTVTPGTPGYTFDPATRSYTNLLENQSAQDYKVLQRGASTAGVFRPTNGLLYLKNSNTTGVADIAINYGTGGDYPVTGDWNGDGIDSIGIYRNGIFYLRNTNSKGVADLVIAFGAPGDQPVVGDWDGDGIDTIGVYRNGLFLLRNSNSEGPAQITLYLGMAGDVGLAGDWTGKGFDTVGVFRPSNGALYLKNMNTSGVADIRINYGMPGDLPVTGDWDNNGTDTIGIYRAGKFYLRNSNTLGVAELSFGLGIPGDMPISGNWDGIP
jgi:Zn-dependent metalloprotease